MRFTEMKAKLEEKIKALEEERRTLLEESDKLKEVLELSEKAKTLEAEVNKLKEEIKSLRDKIPEDILEELSKTVPKILESKPEKEEGEECCQEERNFSKPFNA